MPYDYIRDDARRRVRFNVSAPITDAEMIAMVDLRIADGLWKYGVLVDTRAAAQPPSDMTALINYLAEITAKLGPSGPIAVVARTAPFVGTSKVFAFHAGGTSKSIEVFWDYDEADRWLDAMMATA